MIDHPRYIVHFQRYRWAGGAHQAVPTSDSAGLDVTDIVLNQDAAKLAEALATRDDGKIMSLLEKDLIARYYFIAIHVEDEREPWMLDGRPRDACVEFFTANGIEHPGQITDQDLELIRERYNMPEAVTMPNGRRFIPLNPIDDNGQVFVEGTVGVETADIVGRDIDEVNNLMSEKLTGSDLLMDISFQPVNVVDGKISFLVYGEASDVLKAEYSDDYLQGAAPARP